MNNRQRMRASNKIARTWLLQKGFDQIWLKPHTARNDLVFTQKGNYLATDLWNLFDGICFAEGGTIVFLQFKTNSWPKAEPLQKFVKEHNVKVIVINVTNRLVECKGHFKPFVRMYL